MGRPPPPDEACLLASKLRSQRQSLSDIRKELNKARYEVNSLTTVSDWADRGDALQLYTRLVEDRIEEHHGLDRDRERRLLAQSLDQAMAIVWNTVSLAAADPDTAAKVQHMAFQNLRWMLDMRAKLTNAWAPPHPKQVEVSGELDLPVPAPEVQEAVKKTVRRQEEQVERWRNGGQREA